MAVEGSVRGEKRNLKVCDVYCRDRRRNRSVRKGRKNVPCTWERGEH